MPRTPTNAEFLRSGYQALNGSGVDAVMDLLHPDFERIDLPQAPEAAIPGREGARAWFEGMADVYEGLRLEPEEVIELDEHRVLAVVRMSGRARASGIEISERFAQVWTMRDGLAVRVQVYSTKDEALRDAG